MKVLNVMYHIAPHSIIAFNLTSFYGEGKGFERKKLIDVISKKMITKALEPNVSVPNQNAFPLSYVRFHTYLE